MTTAHHTPADIWLIEDNASDILLARMILEDEQVNVTLTPLKGGQAASERITQEHSAVPDMIFMDLNMPDINGTDILKQLRSNTRYDNVSVFVLSGSEAASDRTESNALGANGYFVKPLSREKIIHAVSLTSHVEAIFHDHTCSIISTRYQSVPIQ